MIRRRHGLPGWSTRRIAGRARRHTKSSFPPARPGSPAGQGILWDSGQVSSSQQFGIVYAGAPLSPTTQYWWQVRTWDKDGQVSPWSAAQSFVTAFFQASDWNPNVQWIRNPLATSSGTTSNPPAMFRKEFQVSKPVQHAYLYITGMGQFVASLNGAKIGNHDMDPAWTDYTQTIDYVAFDVTSQIQQGTNALGVMLGNGWYAYTGTRAFGPMTLWGQLHIIFTDNTSTDVVTDTSWMTTTSPYTRTEVHGSENYDARLYPSGWDVRRLQCFLMVKRRHRHVSGRSAGIARRAADRRCAGLSADSTSRILRPAFTFTTLARI